MKNLLLILALLAVSAMAFACDIATTEEAEAAACISEEGAASCFVDADSDGVCDTCEKTAEECALEMKEGGCENCTSGCDKTGK